MPEQKNRDELDLLQLFLRTVNIIRANFWMILIFFISGTILGGAYFFSAPKVYENNMIISSGILTESYTKVLFDNMNRHLREGNTEAIASQLSLSVQAANKLNQLSIETFSKIQNADTKENDRFLITAEVTDEQVLPELQRGLVGFLENNAFVKVRVQQTKSSLKQVIDEIDAELKDLSEFKTRIANGEFFQNMKGNLMFDPTVVNSKILELKERKITLQHRLELANSVQVIEGFTKFEKQTKPHLSISLMAGSIVGLFFVGILIAFKSIRKLLSMAEEII